MTEFTQDQVDAAIKAWFVVGRDENMLDFTARMPAALSAASIDLNHAARIKELESALWEVLQFQSNPSQPTIHDWGRWRKIFHKLS